jgi:hypothetical protein
MATDATGTPTSPDLIPTYNTSADAPSGLGFIAMAALNATGAPGARTYLRGDGAWTTAPLVTTSALSGGPPGSPSDGDIWVATGVDANGTRWSFQYNAGSASTYKWEFIGGSSTNADVAGNQSTTSNTNVDLGTVQSITLARAGDYLVRWGCDLYATVGAATPVNAVTKAGTVLGEVVNGVGSVNAQMSLSKEVVVPGLAAADVLKSQYRVSANTGNFLNRFMHVVPVRVA